MLWIKLIIKYCVSCWITDILQNDTRSIRHQTPSVPISTSKSPWGSDSSSYSQETHHNPWNTLRCSQQPYSRLYPTGCCFRWIIKRQDHKADYSPPYSVEVQNEWSYTSTPSIHLHEVYRDVAFKILISSSHLHLGFPYFHISHRNSVRIYSFSIHATCPTHLDFITVTYLVTSSYRPRSSSQCGSPQPHNI